MEDASNRQQRENDDHRVQHWQRNIADLLQLPRAVNLGRLEQLRRYPEDPGQVNDAAESNPIP